MYFDNKFSTRPLRFAFAAKDSFSSISNVWVVFAAVGVWCFSFFFLILCSFPFEFGSLSDLEKKNKKMRCTTLGGPCVVMSKCSCKSVAWILSPKGRRLKAHRVQHNKFVKSGLETRF